MLDVIVIGGGPAGSQSAYQLAALGYHVAVLEKRFAVGEKPCCTGIISRECVTNFNIPEEVIYRQSNSAKIFSPSGEFIRVYRPEPPACIINRQAFDRFLARRAQLKGVEYHPRCKAEYISPRPDSVVIGVKEEGCEYQLEAKAVILADGFTSPLVKGMGLGQPDYFVTGVQAEVEFNGIDEVEIYFDQKLAPGFFAWLAPTSNGKGLAGLMTRSSPGAYLRNWIEKLKSQTKITEGKYQIRYSGIPLKPLPRTFGDRLLIVGDAAGQVKPTTGGGIYFGLICSEIAADTLHNAFRNNDFSVKQLSLYEHNWQKRIGQELRREYFARRIYEHLSDNQINKLFSLLRTTGIVESLLQDDNFSFDRHGGLMLKVLKLGIISQTRRVFHPSR